MSALLKHSWRVSPAEDLVWAQIAGMTPSEIRRRWFLTLQAFMDESVDRDGTFVLAGHIADAQSWAKFSVEWERMLPLGVRTDDGGFQFKMSQMAMNPERMDRVAGFYRIIEGNAHHSLSCRINTGELARAFTRVSVPQTNIEWGDLRDPYVAAFRALMDHFHYRRADIEVEAGSLPANAKIDFYFDDRSDKHKIRTMWDGYMAAREPDKRALYGNEPRFEDDRAFLPLQAADLWAWWVRKWSVEGKIRHRITELDFGNWKGKGLARTHISMNEDQWVETLADFIAPQIGSLVPIIDTKTGAVIRLGSRRL